MFVICLTLVLRKDENMKKNQSDLSVKYRNELNLVPLNHFNAKEMDLFFALCSRMKDRGLEKVRFSFDELRDLSEYKPTSLKRFTNDLENLYTKMLNLNYREANEEEGYIKRFVLFTGFIISIKEKFVDVSINPELEYVINGITTEFSRFELGAFTSLRSEYSKTLFRLLMQYRSTGFYVVSIEQFRELMSIPESYQMFNIDQRVLNPAIKELKEYFIDLKLSKVKARKGNKIAKLEFYWAGLKDDLPNVSLHNWLDGE